MKSMSYYIETSAGRHQLIKVLEVLTLTSGAIISVVVLTAIYFRDYA
jgi:hypothetical protein